MLFAVKVIISALIISLSTEVAKRNPSLGGLILALPISSMIAFAVMGFQGTDPAAFSTYTRTTFVMIPVSLVFFLPFILPWSQDWNFISKFSVGITMLTICNLALIKTNFIKM